MLNQTSMPSLVAGADQDELLCGLLAVLGQAPGSFRYLVHIHGMVVFSHQPIGVILHDYRY